MEWFPSRAEARLIIVSWRRHYNEDRPQSPLGYRTPKQFKDEQKQQSEASTDQASLN
jgi:putative transposase